MKTSSAKAKGRRAAKRLAEEILKAFESDLVADDIRVTPSGVTGEDLSLSPRARSLCNFSFECKNVERINIWEAIAQAESHALKKGSAPAVAFTRNHSAMWVCIRVEEFASLLRNANK